MLCDHVEADSNYKKRRAPNSRCSVSTPCLRHVIRIHHGPHSRGGTCTRLSKTLQDPTAMNTTHSDTLTCRNSHSCYILNRAPSDTYTHENIHMHRDTYTYNISKYPYTHNNHQQCGSVMLSNRRRSETCARYNAAPDDATTRAGQRSMCPATTIPDLGTSQRSHRERRAPPRGACSTPTPRGNRRQHIGQLRMTRATLPGMLDPSTLFAPTCSANQMAHGG